VSAVSETLDEKINRWCMDIDDANILIPIYEQIRYLSDTRFIQYHPTLSPHPDFLIRLRDWINNPTDEGDQKTLFRLVPHIFFIGTTEFESLYRAAFKGPLLRWLIDLLNLDFSDPNFETQLQTAVCSSWFCPISDSMNIAAFYHVNNIAGMDLRPDWRTLAKLGDQNRIIQYMRDCGVERLVLLEDFVGSGSQMIAAVEFAANLPTRFPILLTPLIIAPTGVQTAQQLESRFSNLTFLPNLCLGDAALIYEAINPGEHQLFPSVRDVAVRLYSQLCGGTAIYGASPYGPFGFNPVTPHAAALVVMHTNCPDNTLSLVHYRSASWNALFPRSSRL
jgi:hypothetical protein